MGYDPQNAGTVARPRSGRKQGTLGSGRHALLLELPRLYETYPLWFRCAYSSPLPCVLPTCLLSILQLGQFVLPIVYGTFDTRRARIKGRDFQFTLISRRSRFRAGTRYFVRGIDSDGHVANYNETEQIVTYPDGSRTVFVQTRGSIPVYWAEVNNLRYKPDMQVMEWPDQIHAIQMHLKEQVALYGSTSLVNLVNTKGHEQPVREAYERNVRLAKVDNVKYHHFDFHHECKAMRWDRISVLLDQLTPEMEAEG